MTATTGSLAPVTTRSSFLTRFDRPAQVGVGVAILAMTIYWLSNRLFDATRGDFFYLADAFLHGRVWLDTRLGFQDVIVRDGHIFVPFAPFPAVALMPIVAIFGPVVADQWETGINAALAASTVGLAWWFAGRAGVRSLVDRFFLVVLLGFSTQIWWVTTRGGVWHTGHLIATILTLACLIELWGSRRAWLIGLLAGAAFMTRAPLAFAIPFYALLLAGDRIWEPRRWPWRTWFELALGFLPMLAFFFWYNAARFGSPLESGYGLALLPDWLEQQRKLGLFSTAHLQMNINYLFLRVPRRIDEFPFFQPDGLGMSIFITSPGLLYAVRARWRESLTWWLALAALIVLIPTLLYYGGGWLQYGYRYALDSIPLVWALCALAAVRDEEARDSVALEGSAIGTGWRILIGLGVLVGLGGVYWAYNLH
ncbi:MAG TPA: hypothetical protein VHM48_07635 [Candidatus Limnocylindrales bacterium]|nr:hypothetical protein [Candidatus Limnocylindrales bacterium]